MPTFLVIKEKWNNIVEIKAGGGTANVDYFFSLAKDQIKWNDNSLTFYCYNKIIHKSIRLLNLIKFKKYDNINSIYLKDIKSDILKCTINLYIKVYNLVLHQYL